MRQTSSLDALNLLPEGSIILDGENTHYVKQTNKMWLGIGHVISIPVDRITGPFTILYVKPGIDQDGVLHAGPATGKPLNDPEKATIECETSKEVGPLKVTTRILKHEDGTVTAGMYVSGAKDVYDHKWEPISTVADLYTTEYILWRINQALENVRKPWLHAQPGETWLIHAYNEHRGRRMWMIADVTSRYTFIVKPPTPNDTYTLYYQLNSPSIHKARKLEEPHE